MRWAIAQDKLKFIRCTHCQQMVIHASVINLMHGVEWLLCEPCTRQMSNALKELVLEHANISKTPKEA